MFFLWNDWNEEHIATHRVEPSEAEYVIRHAKRPYPRKTSAVKWVVHGRTAGNRLLQVIYVIRDPMDIDVRLLSADELSALEQGEAAAYVIHARPLRAGEH
jgi:hypothetical protein